MATAGVHFEEEDFMNERGMHLNTCRWLPVEKEVKGLVFLCHGYGMECTIYTRETGQRLAMAGFDVYGIDYEGHGKSEGLRGYVPDFYNLVLDCAAFFNGVMDREENAAKPRFLLGESMGGAESILISRKDPARWRGLVLVASILKISQKVKPPPLVSCMLLPLRKFIPTWKMVPVKNLIKKSYKDLIKLNKIQANPCAYQGNHSLQTALELLQASTSIEEHMEEVFSPFLCVHGMEDSVNEPQASQELFNSAASIDKTLKLYPEIWQGLMTGDPDKNVDLVFEDIIIWLRNSETFQSKSSRGRPLDPPQ